MANALKTKKYKLLKQCYLGTKVYIAEADWLPISPVITVFTGHHAFQALRMLDRS